MRPASPQGEDPRRPRHPVRCQPPRTESEPAEKERAGERREPTRSEPPAKGAILTLFPAVRKTPEETPTIGGTV
jgi:hypothetical protein